MSIQSDQAPHGLSMTEISHSIGLARILLIVGLVFLHYSTFPNSKASPFEGIDIHEHLFATWLNSAILFFFFSAVPLLSMVSGWLFFSFTPADAWPSIFRRIRRRFTSLYLPLVVWNTAYLILFYMAYRLNPDAVNAHIGRLGIDFQTATWKDYMNSAAAVTYFPIGFQFWFVRDLFVTALVSPLFWIMINRAPWISTIIMAAIWLSSWNMIIFLRPDVPFFFFLGALIHQKRLTMLVPFNVTITAFAIFVTIACVRALFPYWVDFTAYGYPDYGWIYVITCIMRLFGVVGCWGLIYRWARTDWGIKLSAYGGLAFFLHSAHWPLLAMVKIVLWHFMPGENDAWMLVHYVISVLTTVGIGIGCGLFLAHKMPRVFALMNGGRMLGQTKSA